MAREDDRAGDDPVVRGVGGVFRPPAGGYVDVASAGPTQLRRELGGRDGSHPVIVSNYASRGRAAGRSASAGEVLRRSDGVEGRVPRRPARRPDRTRFPDAEARQMPPAGATRSDARHPARSRSTDRCPTDADYRRRLVGLRLRAPWTGMPWSARAAGWRSSRADCPPRRRRRCP